MSTAIQKRSRGVSVKRPSRSSAAANATECTSRSRPPSKVSPTSEKSRARSSSERTSHAVTRGLETESASSRTFFSSRSPWNVNASEAPSSASRLAIPHAIERRLATPSTSPVLPSKRMAARSYETRAAVTLRPDSAVSTFRYFGYPRRTLRRLVAPLIVVAALASAVPASADLRPVRRDFRERHVPLVRTGELQIPRGQHSGRIRVIVRLAQPPLAAWQGGVRLRSVTAPARLNVRSASSRAYLGRLASAQRAAIRELRREIPNAKVGRRFGILLNGITVDLPAARLPELVRSSFATRVYPSVRYSLATNRSPSIIGADAMSAATGARGDGIKIAVVDDGVDPQNAFFNPAGFSYPAGFPRGGTRWTTPKVIVARAFPGPGSGRPGRLALDPQASFHGTHVAGIAAGVAQTTAPAGGDHPPTTRPSRLAPRARVGHYPGFTGPTPIGHVANTPEIVAAFESAVRDGMHVINFSGGG